MSYTNTVKKKVRLPKKQGTQQRRDMKRIFKLCIGTREESAIIEKSGSSVNDIYTTTIM